MRQTTEEAMRAYGKDIFGIGALIALAACGLVALGL